MWCFWCELRVRFGGATAGGSECIPWVPQPHLCDLAGGVAAGGKECILWVQQPHLCDLPGGVAAGGRECIPEWWGQTMGGPR